MASVASSRSLLFPSCSPVLYDGLVDTYGLSDEDYFYMDAKIRLGIGGVTTYSQKLLNMTEVPVCSAFTSNAYNSYGDCPADGRYGYSSSFDFPAPSKVDLMSWATTGYEGDILLDVYVQTSLVGRCVVPIKTMVTGSYEKGFFETKPSGAIAAIIAASLMALLVMYAMCLLIKACQARRTKRKTLRQEAHADYASSYNRMESGAEDDSTDITPSISMVSNAESRYSLPGGPVI